MIGRLSLVLLFSRTSFIQGFSTFGRTSAPAFASKADEGKKNYVAALRMSEDVTKVEETEEDDTIVESNIAIEEKTDDVESEEDTDAAESEEKTGAVESKGDDYSQTVYVVNLSYDTSNQDIRSHFSQVGEVKKVFVPLDRDSGAGKGFAFVTMGSEEKRDAVIESLNESELGGRKIYVAKAKPRGGPTTPKKELTKLYVGNISYETSSKDLAEFFSEWGPVSDIFIPTDRDTGLPRGFAFLSMEKEEAAKAIEGCADGVELQGRYIEVNVSLPKGQKAPPRKREEVKLYIGNLPFETDIDTVNEIFSEYGEIIDTYAPVDRFTDRPRGFAFITMNPESAAKAIEELDGFELDGRLLRVNEAQPKGSSNSSDDWGEEDDGSW